MSTQLAKYLILLFLLLIEYGHYGAPGWLSWLSVQLLVSAQVMISCFVGSSPRVRLCVDRAGPAWDSLSPSLSASLPFPVSFKNSTKIWSMYTFFFSTFIYFWDRERQSMNGGGAEREGDTESETGSRLRAISPEPDAGLELTDREIVTWLKSDA